MYISVFDMFFLFYSMLEQYIVENIRFTKTTKRSDFFEMVEQLEITDCSEEDSVVNVETPIETKNVEVSQLDNDATLLLSALNKEFSDEPISLENNSEVPTEEYCPPLWEEIEDGVIIEDGDCLSMADVKSYQESVPETNFKVYPSFKIKDNVEGPQQWCITVIGKEGDYLHVTDGSSRKWLMVKENEVEQIGRGDVLLMDLQANNGQYQVERIVTLETGATEDYLIPDESTHMNYQQEIAV